MTRRQLKLARKSFKKYTKSLSNWAKEVVSHLKDLGVENISDAPTPDTILEEVEEENLRDKYEEEEGEEEEPTL